MRIGITGGTGNISLYITRRLVAKGHEVVIFNRSGGTVAGAKTAVVDRKDEERFVAKVRSERLDVGIEMLVYTEADAELTMRAFAGVHHLIHCSSGASYGFPLPIPVTEETVCRAEQSYGKNKRLADALFLRAYHNDGFPVTIMKPNVTYGFKFARALPGQLSRGWLRRLIEGKPIVVVGDGDQLHHFNHSDDCAKGFVACVGNERAVGQVFNNCSTQAYTWRQWHETVMKIIGTHVPIVGIPRGRSSQPFRTRTSPRGEKLVVSHGRLQRKAQAHKQWVLPRVYARIRPPGYSEPL
jgi:nucleoside-diphosphate-sugar epimerase